MYEAALNSSFRDGLHLGIHIPGFESVCLCWPSGRSQKKYGGEMDILYEGDAVSVYILLVTCDAMILHVALICRWT